MSTHRRFSRRSFLGLVTGGAAVGGAALLGASDRAEAFQSDNDRGTFADRKGQGFGETARVLGDIDSGPYADSTANGRQKGEAAAERAERAERERRERQVQEAQDRARDPPEHPESQ